MLKQILPLLFTFIFSINLFAESHDIHREISDIKLQIQEIKFLNARDEREKKIEKLEEDIKKLEEKFNKGDVDKKEIDGKIGTQDKLISEIGSNTNRVSWLISMFGVLITVIIIFFALKFGKNIDQEIQNIKKEAEEQIKKEAEEQIKKWIDEKADNEFKPKVDNYLKQIDEKSNELLNKIKSKSENLHQETKDLNEKYRKEIDLLQNNKYTEEEKDNLNKEVKKIRENKKEEDYTFSDRYNLFLFKYTNNEFEEALSILEKISTLKVDDKNLVKVLFAKGVTHGQLGQSEEAIEVYDELIERFKDSKENVILEQVASALVNKGITLGKLEKSKEAIKIYDEVVRRFIDLKDSSILKQVTKALSNKIETNLILGNKNSKEDLNLCFYLIKENEEELINFEMLQIVEKAKGSIQDKEIKEWQIKFENINFSEEWSFDELKIWAETLKDEVKERILRYIDIFENHNKNIEEK